MKNRFLREEELIAKVQDGEMTLVDYVTNQSQEIADEYEGYCKFHGLDPSEEASAEAYLEMLDKELVEGLESGEA